VADDLIPMREAQRLLGVSKKTMSEIVKRGDLPVAGRDPLDRRIRLVRRSDVQALLNRSSKKVA
jgi:hypothetical protein